MTQKIQFTLLNDFKTNLQKIAIYGESFWELLKFASLSQKNGLISLSKFRILKPFTNIQLYRRFDLSFWQTLEEVKGNSNKKKKSSQSFIASFAFPEKWFSIR